jgi:hypothetical protein
MREDYIEVKDRIAMFLADFPEASLQGSYEFVETSEGTLIVFTAKAYRSPDDPRPGVGHAQEAFPGKTAFTRGSEMQNAETSAWGRAIAALGIATHKGVASADEVRQAREAQAAREQLNAIKAEVLERANEWAEDNDAGFESKTELVKGYLDARGLTLPRDTVEGWTEVIKSLND